MKIFEFHFNPKKEKNKIFNSFIYEPENAYERRVGNLYIIGEIRNTIPQNYLFLNKIAEKIKDSYYKINSNISLEESLRKSLELANNYLEKQEEKNNISWLGNLSLATFNLKNLNINFSKIGKIKILLLRGEKIIDLSNELEKKEGNINSRNFSNIVSGNLSPSDKLIIMTQSVFDSISEKNILLDLLAIFTKEVDSKQADKEIKKVLKKEGKLLDELSGIFLLIELEKPEKETSQMKRPITSKESIFPQIPSFPSIKNQKIRDKVSKIKLPSLKNFNFLKKFPTLKGKIKKPSFSPSLPALPSLSFLPKISLGDNRLKKSIILIVIFLVVLGTGNHFSKMKEEKKIEKIENQINKIQEKVNEAENALAYQSEEKANELYQEAWKEILALNQEDILKEEIEETRNSIKEKLYYINKIEEVNNPELVFEIKSEEINPQEILVGENYFILNKNLNKIWQRKEEEWITMDNNDSFLAEIFNDYLLILSPPNKLTFLKNGESIQKEISVPYPNISDISSFGSNIYFLDQQNKEIIKTTFRENAEKLEVTTWLSSETKKPDDPKSMAIDGSIWILNENNSIEKYYKGSFEREITISLFPDIDRISKLRTNPNTYYLFLLDKTEDRIIVLNKKGELNRQLLFNEEELKDFHLAQDGESIYVLTQNKVYKIPVEL